VQQHTTGRHTVVKTKCLPVLSYHIERARGRWWRRAI